MKRIYTGNSVAKVREVMVKGKGHVRKVETIIHLHGSVGIENIKKMLRMAKCWTTPITHVYVNDPVWQMIHCALPEQIGMDIPSC